MPVQRSHSIFRVEIEGLLLCPIDCPVCRQRVVIVEGDSDVEYAPCPHTLFIAVDDGFMYMSESVSTNLGISSAKADEIDMPDEGPDFLTDRITLPNTLKIATYDYPPSMYGFYIGFDLGTTVSEKQLEQIIADIESLRDKHCEEL